MKNSFVLYTSCRKQFRQLSNEQAGVLIKAIFAYEAEEKEMIPAMDDRTEMAFSFIQSALDADAEKYEKVCEGRRNAGKLGGRPSGKGDLSEKQKKQMVFSESKKSKRAPDNDYDFEFDSDIDREKEGARKGTEEKDGSIPETAFDKFWALYPKKKSKGEARRAWKELNPDRSTCEAIMKKLPELIDSPEWKEEGGLFIPYPATWLNAEGWNDEAGAAEGTKPKSRKNRFCDFPQRVYDCDELERRLLLRDGPGNAEAAGVT